MPHPSPPRRHADTQIVRDLLHSHKLADHRKVRQESSKWYAFGVPGATGAVPLATSKRVAEQILARLIADGECAAAGLSTSAERGKSVAVLIDEYRLHLLARGAADKHADSGFPEHSRPTR